MNCQLIVSIEAKKYFQNILKTNNQAINLELKNAGCSGYMYQNTIADIQINKDTHELIMANGIPFIVKKEQKPLINNTVVNFKKEGLNNKIVFEHPEAYHSCGCGESFAIKKETV